ncbi:uncharacterized protein LOC119734193 [Patiria miniata]|uniref:Uncharacterized protein n=1 Tax=Patiria miniata TaxID=46514 RepID=A0A914AJ91_PATMI|nr:uncharacterized protein LOC119734193 [Patiria miniata]
MLTPWYPATPVSSRASSPRPTHRSSFNIIPENADNINDTAPDEGRQQRANSRSFLGRLIHRKSRTGTSSSYGSTSTIDQAVDTEICIEVPQDRTPPKILENGAELDSSNTNQDKGLQDEADKSYQDNKDDGDDNVFLDVEPRPRLASAESSCSEYEAPADGDNQLPKKERSTTLVYKPPVEDKEVQTEHVDYMYADSRSMPCEYCRHRCLCYRIDPYDSNSSTQSLKLNAEEKSKRRRKRWSPLIRKRQLLMKQAIANQPPTRVGHYEHGYQSTPIRPRPSGMLAQITDTTSQSQPPSPKRWHMQYRQNRRRRRTFSEDRVDEMNSAAGPHCGNTNSDPSLCPQKSTFALADENRQSDPLRHARLYNLCLQKAKMPLVKSSSYSPTVPLRRQTWSEKSRPNGPSCEGPKKTKGFLYMLRNLRSSCSETDISMEHRPSVDSNGYVDPFYITRHFNRLNLKRLSLSHPNLNTGFKGSTTPPSSLKGKVTAAVGRLERALTGRASFGRTYSLESQQSTSNGWNSDLPGSPTDSDAAAYSYGKHYRRDSNTENGYMTFDPELNPPMRRPRPLLSSSCSSAPSSPGFQEGLSMGFDDVTSNTGNEEECIYESLDNYSPKRRASTLKSLPSSDGEAPPEVPPRPPAHRLRHRQRMLRRQMPLPPIPNAHSTTDLGERSQVPITTTSSAGNIHTAMHSLYKTTGSRHNFISGQSSSCSTLPSFRMDSSEEDSVFEAQVENASLSKTLKGRTIGDTGLGKLKGEEYTDANCNHDNLTDTCVSGKNCNSHRANDLEIGASSTINGN